MIHLLSINAMMAAMIFGIMEFPLFADFTSIWEKIFKLNGNAVLPIPFKICAIWTEFFHMFCLFKLHIFARFTTLYQYQYSYKCNPAIWAIALILLFTVCSIKNSSLSKWVHIKSVDYPNFYKKKEKKTFKKKVWEN